MTSPVLDLRAAIRSVLSSNSITIYDEARDVTMPFASFGESTVKLWSDGALNYADHRVAIHVWSRAPGDAEALTMSGQIATLVEKNKPNLDGVTLVHWTVTGHDMRRPTREGVRTAILRIHAMTEFARGT